MSESLEKRRAEKVNINMDRVKAALPVETGNGRRSTIRARADVTTVVVDCVLRRVPFQDIAKRCCVDLESLTRFSDHRTIGAHIGVSPLAGYW